MPSPEDWGHEDCAVCEAARQRERAALDVLDGAGVVFEDERVSYVEIQVDRDAWLRWLEASTSGR